MPEPRDLRAQRRDLVRGALGVSSLGVGGPGRVEDRELADAQLGVAAGREGVVLRAVARHDPIAKLGTTPVSHVFHEGGATPGSTPGLTYTSGDPLRVGAC